MAVLSAVAVVVAFVVVGLRRVDEGQSGSPEMSSMALAAVRSAMAVIVAFVVVGLRRVDEGQSGSLEMSSLALAVAVCSAVAVVVAFGVVGLRRVDEGQSGSLEMSSVALAMAVRSAMAVVVAFGVVGLRRVDEGQSGSPEMSSMACSSEIKEDGLRFVERQRGSSTPSKLLVLRAKNGYVARKLKSVNMAIINVGIINPFKVACFESKERLRSSEIKGVEEFIDPQLNEFIPGVMTVLVGSGQASYDLHVLLDVEEDLAPLSVGINEDLVDVNRCHDDLGDQEPDVQLKS